MSEASKVAKLEADSRDPCTLEAETMVLHVRGQLGLQSENLSQKANEKKSKQLK